MAEKLVFHQITKSVFEKLSSINVNNHVEKKKDLSYLSWAWAWSETKKACPDATYKIGITEYDDALGFMCHTTVTIEGETLEMWLPVMDGANKSMKKQSYKYQTKFGEKTVEAATTFDINKTIMRCLVKNLAMFGLGIYIYAGEDLPESEEIIQNASSKLSNSASSDNDDKQWLNPKTEQFNKAKAYLETGGNIEAIKAKYNMRKETEELLQSFIKN